MNTIYEVVKDMNIRSVGRTTPARRVIRPTAGTPITANRRITAGIQNRKTMPSGQNNIFASLSPEKAKFARQLQQNMRKQQSAITAATNTTNIMARPDFMDMLPMFVQELILLDVFGSVAMKSRQELIPYFKFIAENTKGETNRGDVLSSPFANRQGADPNFTGRTIKNEVVGEGTDIAQNMSLVYTPVLPKSVSIKVVAGGTAKTLIDDGNGNLCLTGDTTPKGYIDYSTGLISSAEFAGDTVNATYQYDNENVGPRTPDNGGYGYEYGAQMAKGYLQLSEINLIAEAHELACYWSVYSAFAAKTEYGENISDVAKSAAFSEITAEINTAGFNELYNAATLKPQFDWDASPVLSGSVVPSDYLNMFKLKLTQAAASTYQATHLAQPNRLIVGTNVAAYISMINGFQAAPIGESVGPYKLGTLDQFEIYANPSYNPDVWVMACKSNDIRRNSALFGEYMPLTDTDAIGLANASVQQGYATMYALKVINPETVISGRILGTF